MASRCSLKGISAMPINFRIFALIPMGLIVESVAQLDDSILVTWGPDADRRAKLLICLAVEGALLDAYSHLWVKDATIQRDMDWHRKLNPNAGRSKMQIAPEITFEGTESSDAARAQILSEMERLETHNHRITGCRVKVIAPSHKHRHGTGFQVHIWLTIPPHENIIVDQSASSDARNEHAQVAIKDAFAAVRRQIDALAA
jgi:ribosome-associated translation inhibitor RaiA